MRNQPLLINSIHSLPPSHPYNNNNVALASSYRTVQLPLRPPDLPAGYHHSTNFHRQLPLRMSSYQQPDDELARLQELSNKYEPEATGPLVSERLLSSAITTEYAKADPVYQTKTAALPQKYSHYRTCRGDGHCGWRAVAFSYFEMLQRLGERHKFLQEETRLRSLENLLKAVGFIEFQYEDFADDTFDLLRQTADNSPALDDGAALLAAFNDENLSMGIITYLKLLTSAWIQTHPDEYQPFIHQSAREYCQSCIEPIKSEIEHVGMSALVDVLVKPAGLAVEILYLDRTPGQEVNMYRFDPVDQNGLSLPDPPTLRLLYRPGHYDILYKMEDIPQPILPPQTSQGAVLVALGQVSDYNHLGTGHDPLTDVPGLSFNGGAALGWLPSSYNSNPHTAIPAPVMPTFAPAPTPAYAPLPLHQTSHDYSRHALPLDPPVSHSIHPPAVHGDRGAFRPSKFEFERDFGSAPPQSFSFQTSIFRNSHYNIAHFNNPDFQPEEWKPDDEYVTKKPSGGRPKPS